MGKYNLELMETLEKFETQFKEDIEEGNVVLLRDIKVEKNVVQEIGENISTLYKIDKVIYLKYKFPLTLSLFLVWCTIYEYKDGDMWSKIFEYLDISTYSYKDQQVLGDIFLHTINQYNLMQVKEGEGKKYLSPILMHGYISNHYAFDLFDYLNKIYTIVLEEDTSEIAINNIWSDIFSEDTEFKNLRKQKILLEYKKKDLVTELNNNYQIDDEIKHITYKFIKALETEVNGLEKLTIQQKGKIDSLNNKASRNEKIGGYLIKSRGSVNILKENNKDKDLLELKEVDALLKQISKDIQEQDTLIKIKTNELVKENKKIYNQLTVKRETLISTKTKISILGEGVLDEGWEIIKEYNNLISKLNKIELQINNVNKLQAVAELEQNATIKQILTASLYNLRRSDPEYFKKFIVDTLQMMDGFFSGGQINDFHPLGEVLIKWSKRDHGKDIYIPTIESKRDKNALKTRGKRLVLQKFKKPYMELDTNSLDLNIVIPEQNLLINKELNIKPCYSMIDTEGINIDLKIDYTYYNNNLYIKDKKIKIESNSYEYLFFQWYNLREIYNISLDPIMIFSDAGDLISNRKLKNGYYFVVCEKSFFIDEKLIIKEYNTSVDNYKIIELYLNEIKIKFASQNGNSLYEFLATDYNFYELDNYNVINGIYADNVPVTIEKIPGLTINCLDRNVLEYNLKLHMNDSVVFEKELKDLIKADKYIQKDSKVRIDIGDLLNFNNRTTPSKFKIELSSIGREPLLEEEFYYLPKTKFEYKNNGLNILISMGMRFHNNNYKKNGMEYVISLKNKKNEKFRIYYNKYGWIDFKVEIPYVDVKIFDKDRNQFNKDNILYGSKLEKINDLILYWETNNKTLNSILLFDNNHDLEIRVYLKEGKAKTSIKSYLDIFRDLDEGELLFKIENNINLTEEHNLLQMYDKWKVYNIKVYQKEEKEEYILGVNYDENFTLKDERYLEIMNEDKVILRKLIKDEIYIYIKKQDLISNKIKIRFFYKDVYENIFGKNKIIVEAGINGIELKSKTSEIANILKKGIICKGFKYFDKNCNFKYPLRLYPIRKADSKNFIGEEIYMTKLKRNDKLQEIFFYIDYEKKILPFLLDNENDGAQYNPKTGDIFWENTSKSYIMGPIENIKYLIKGEE